VTGGPEAERLPPSIGGLVDFAFTTYVSHAPLYLGLALAVLLIGTAVEFAIPAAKLDTPSGALKLFAIQFAAMCADAYVITAVAIGVGTRLAGEPASWGQIARASLTRWLAVLATLMIVQLVAFYTAPLSGLGPLPDPPVLAVFTAPFVWLIWGILSLALPIAALADEPPAFAIFAGLSRAISYSMRVQNLARLVLVAFVSILPNLLQAIVEDVLVKNHVPRPFYWADIPIDALTVGVIAALQTVFAIDFARRAADQRSA